MRILHLIDEASPQSGATTLAMLSAALGRLGELAQDVMLMGGSRFIREARALGVEPAHGLGAPLGQPLLSWPALASRMRALRAGQPYDLVHCWSIKSFTLASMLWRRTPRVLSQATAPSPRGVHWLRMLCHENAGRMAILPMSSTIRRELLAGGVPEPLVHVLRPGLDFSRPQRPAREALFERWDIDIEAASDARIVALLSDPAHAADAGRAALVRGLAETSRLRRPDGALEPPPPPIYLVVHPRQLHRRRAEAMDRAQDQPVRVVQDAAIARPWELLPTCDAALALGPHAGGLSLLWAAVSGVPIIGEATYAISEIVEDHHSALLAKPGDAQALAHRLRRVLDDRNLAWALRDTARSEAFSFFSRQRYCEAIRGIYTQLLAGKPIEVPDLPITGGLRFSGRA